MLASKNDGGTYYSARAPLASPALGRRFRYWKNSHKLSAGPVFRDWAYRGGRLSSAARADDHSRATTGPPFLANAPGARPACGHRDYGAGPNNWPGDGAGARSRNRQPPGEQD